MNFSLWKTFITSGRSVVVTSSARSRPLPLKWRCLAFNGMANMLFAPHSKRMAAAVGEFDLRAPVTFEHVEHVLVEVALRHGRSGGGDVEQQHAGEIAAALQMHRGALTP